MHIQQQVPNSLKQCVRLLQVQVLKQKIAKPWTVTRSRIIAAGRYLFSSSPARVLSEVMFSHSHSKRAAPFGWPARLFRSLSEICSSYSTWRKVDLNRFARLWAEAIANVQWTRENTGSDTQPLVLLWMHKDNYLLCEQQLFSNLKKRDRKSCDSDGLTKRLPGFFQVRFESPAKTQIEWWCTTFFRATAQLSG